MNRLWQRSGAVIADRFHAVSLESPRQVRYAIAYVLHNARRHGLAVASVDTYSSGVRFAGWRETLTVIGAPKPATKPADTWLLKSGWRRSGLIDFFETPKARVAGS